MLINMLAFKENFVRHIIITALCILQTTKARPERGLFSDLLSPQGGDEWEQERVRHCRLRWGRPHGGPPDWSGGDEEEKHQISPPPGSI